MKYLFPFISSLLISVCGIAQTVVPMPLPKKSMLGVYNTSTLSIMPVSKSNNYIYYDITGLPYYNSERRTGYSFRNTTGYRFFDFLNVGAGFGVDNYESTALDIPLYGEISGNILGKRFFPSYYAQAGYGIGVNLTGKGAPNRINKAEGGLMAAGGIGFGARLDKNTIVRLNFGYRLQKASYTSEIPQYNMPSYIQVRHMTYHRVEIGLNFTFQQ